MTFDFNYQGTKLTMMNNFPFTVFRQAQNYWDFE